MGGTAAAAQAAQSTVSRCSPAKRCSPQRVQILPLPPRPSSWLCPRVHSALHGRDGRCCASCQHGKPLQPSHSACSWNAAVQAWPLQAAKDGSHGTSALIHRHDRQLGRLCCPDTPIILERSVPGLRGGTVAGRIHLTPWAAEPFSRTSWSGCASPCAFAWRELL